ncbi:MAG: hypothetical protein WAQ98_08335 [Blastocatellia bacterium]
MSINIINFPKETYLGIRIDQIVIGITFPKAVVDKHKRDIEEQKTNLVFVIVLLKLRQFFADAIKEGKLQMQAKEMEQITVNIAKSYCKTIR